jgi:hypothetical protein
MNRFTGNLVAAAAFIVLACGTTTSEAVWPRYRVSNSYSLPSVPAYRPVYQAAPILLPAAPAPGYVAPNYGAPVVPNISVPNTTYYPPGYAAPGYATSGYAAPGYAAPGYAAPGYATPGYAAPQTHGANYVPAPTTSYYAPQQPVFQPYQQPRPIHQYAQPMQAASGYYQPNRPATFYSPTPGYHYPQSVFGGY